MKLRTIAVVLALLSGPAEAANSVKLSGPLTAIRPHLSGGPLAPPVMDGCVLTVAALQGGGTVEVLAPLATGVCTVQPGRNVVVEGELVDAWCELDACMRRLSVVARRVKVKR